MTTTTAADTQRRVALIRRQITQPDIMVRLWLLPAETGQPVSVDELAAAGGWSRRQVTKELARQPGTDWSTDKDEVGRIAGFGLTLRPTPHAFTFAARTVYGFCASDTLDFPVVLGRAGVAESMCPATGRPVRIEVTPDGITSTDPATAVVSRMRPWQAVPDVRQLCNLGHFYSTPETAAGWVAAHPDGEVVPVADEFTVVRHAMIQLGWAADAPRPASRAALSEHGRKTSTGGNEYGGNEK